MNPSRRRSTTRASALGRIAILLSCLLLPSAAAAELSIPVTLQITELVQLDHDQDPGAFGIGQSLGDLYAVVTIDGTTSDNFDDRCDNPPPTFPEQSVFDTPYVFFNQDGSILDPSCRNVPWTFVHDVPLADFTANPDGIKIRIRILDSDGGIFGGDDDLLEDFVLDVPFGGRFTGAVDWPENCLNGNKADVCFEIEAGADADGDGLLDDWEQNGIDVDGNGSIDLNLPAMGANPLHKDIFVELDWRPGFEPQRAGIQRWKEAFAAAPIDAGDVANPDGQPGITLHVDTGALTEGGLLVGDNLGGGNALGAAFPACSLSNDQGAFYPAKAANFDAATRSLAFRYGITSTRCCMFGPNRGTPCTADSQCAGALCQAFGGQAEIGGNDLIVWNSLFQDSTLMHELGHTLNLRHGGANNDNCKPDYMSIMNYDHFEIQRLDGSSILDFSPPRLPNGARGTAPLDDLIESQLDETRILDPADPQSFLVYTDATGKKRLSLVGARVDWNGNGSATETSVAVNVDTSDLATNFPALCANTTIRDATEPLTGHDDWHAVSLPFLQFADAADGPIDPVDDPEPTDDELLEHREGLNTADLSIAKTGTPGPFEAGSTVDLAYTLSIANQGPNPAVKVRVADALPPGAVVLTHDPACVASAAGLTCDLPALLPAGSASVQLTARAPARCSGGVPTPITNTATVANVADFAGPDPDPLDDRAVFATAVVDTTPPTLSLVASPATLWPPNHKMIGITVTVQSTDVCDDTPTIRLVSITSNEPDDAPGSGNTGPDVEGAAFGTDDRQFFLRAERSGGGDGRTYRITYSAEDGSGNVTQRVVTVTVPKSRAS